MVAIEQPIQNQEQTGGTSDVPTEHNATSTLGGTVGPQQEPNN